MEPSQRTTIIKETFNTVSKAYDCKALRFFPATAAHLASILNLHGNERIIDIATGTGNAALALSGYLPHGSVKGIDFSAGMLEQARKKAARQNVRNVEFLEMDMQEINLAEAGFDVATCAFGIFFVEDMDSQLAQIASLVRECGTIAICNFQEGYFNPLRDLMVTRLVNYGVQLPPQTWRRIATEEGCRVLFESAGIRNIRVEEKNMGFYLADENEWWDLIWNAGFRGLLKQLEQDVLERFRQEHLKEVAELATDEGIWLDVGVLYTMGTKE
ncbi:MAG: methyltransferase domain-containing protein [Desulfuromonadaceae bacterium]|nr:methyltransferase domain-containing protein [Desulfuromonadaceae bacterium]MDD5105650.1 methyltransferase domain-containing protein [Desulfuromonadaceae bacterium]